MMTFLAALRHDRINAPRVIDGPIDDESFQIYIEKMLVPVLKRGDIVIFDNLASHKGQRVRRAIRGAGARLLFLPPYSPDLNPIKGSLCQPQTPCFSPNECQAYLQNAGICFHLNTSRSSGKGLERSGQLVNSSVF